MEVSALAGLLREAEEHHARYEPTAPPHQWWDWYAGYVVARERGRTPEQSSSDAAALVGGVRPPAATPPS